MIDPIRSNVNEANAARGAHPFVTISDVVGCIDFGDVERDHSRYMGPIHKGINPTRRQCGNQFFDRKYNCGSTWNMVDQGEFGAIGGASHNTLKYLSLGHDWKWNFRYDHFCTISCSHKIEQHLDGTIHVTCGENLIPRQKSLTLNHHIHGLRRPRH